MKNLISLFAVALIFPFSLFGNVQKNADSPNGKYRIIIEKDEGGLSIVSPEGKSPTEIIKINKDSLSPLLADKNNASSIAWNPSSSFFVISAQTQEGIFGNIIAFTKGQNTIVVSPLKSNFERGSVLTAYTFIGKNELRLTQKLTTGRIAIIHLTIADDGRVHGVIKSRERVHK